MKSDSSRQLIGFIGRAYGVKELSVHSKDDIGILSDNHVLIDSDGKKYFLKKYRFTDGVKIELVHTIKKYFHRKGIPVILPLKSISGSTLKTFEGGFYALFPFVEGKVIGREELTNANAESMGRMLAKIHLAGREQALLGVEGKTLTRDEKEFTERVETVLHIIFHKEKKDEYDKQAEYLLTGKLKAIQSLEGHGFAEKLKDDHLIHGDFHNYNVFFNKLGQVSEVFDWEKSKLGPRSYEIARSIDLSCFDIGYTERDYSRARSFLRGYNVVYPISKDEFSEGFQYYYYTQIFSVWIEEAHYLNNNKRPDIFMDRAVKRFDYYEKNFESMIEKLSEVLS